MTPVTVGSAAQQPSRRALIYARQSLDRTGEGAAVERQISACRALAEARGWTVVHVEVDNDVSASTAKVRPGYQRLLGHVRAGTVERVVVWHVDRLTRRLVDLEEVITACEGSGVGLATVTGDLDLSTDTGRMLARILTSVARGEVERKGTRQRAANRQRLEAGVMGWSRRPFGYQRIEGGKVVTVPAEAAALQRAAAAVLNGSTLAAAARALTDDGHTTSTGGPWSVTPLRRVLLSPRYAGRASYLGADVATGEWPVILDADLQERLSAVLREPRRRVQQGTELRYLLSGSARCGRCGQRLYASPMGSKGNRWQVYKCRGCYLARRSDLVDEVVVGVVLARLQRPDAAALLTTSDDVEGLRARVVDLRERRDALASLIADGLLGASAGRLQAKGLTQKLHAAEADLERALGTSPAAALVGADDVADVWAGLPIRQQRAVVDELLSATVLFAGKGVRWAPEQVSIEWKVAP